MATTGRTKHWQARVMRDRREDKLRTRRTRMAESKQIAAARATRVRKKGVKVSEIDATTATTHAERGNQQPGSGHRGGVPPSPTSSAAAPASDVRCAASTAGKR